MFRAQILTPRHHIHAEPLGNPGHTAADGTQSDDSNAISLQNIGKRILGKLFGGAPMALPKRIHG